MERLFNFDEQILLRIEQLGNWLREVDETTKNINNVVNFLDFKKNGKTDGEALKEAIETANTGVTPAGGWKRVVLITKNIVIHSAEKIKLPTSVTLRGNSYSNVEIKFTSKTGGFLIDRRDADNNPIAAYEVHFENIKLNGAGICDTVITANRLYNARWKNVYIENCADFPVKLLDGSMYWFDGITLDGASFGDKTMKGFYLDKGVMWNNNCNFWCLDHAFYLANQAPWLQIGEGCWIEKVSTTIVCNPVYGNNIDTLNVVFSDCYILTSGTPKWNLIRTEYNNNICVYNAKLTFRNFKVYIDYATSLGNDCICYLSDMKNGSIINIEIDGMTIEGKPKTEGTHFIGMDNKLRKMPWKVLPTQVKGLSYFKMNEIVNVGTYAINRNISEGLHAYPVIPRIKLTNNYNDDIKGTIGYSESDKCFVGYVGNSTSKDFRFIPWTRVGEGAPTNVITPTRIGEFYVDSKEKSSYISVGSSSKDWRRITI